MDSNDLSVFVYIRGLIIFSGTCREEYEIVGPEIDLRQRIEGPTPEQKRAFDEGADALINCKTYVGRESHYSFTGMRGIPIKRRDV